MASRTDAARAVSAVGGWSLGLEPRGPLFQAHGAALRIYSDDGPGVAIQAQELARERLNQVERVRPRAVRKAP